MTDTARYPHQVIIHWIGWMLEVSAWPAWIVLGIILILVDTSHPIIRALLLAIGATLVAGGIGGMIGRVLCD